MDKDKKLQLIKEFTLAINKVNIENNSNTPDFILAGYLVMCLDTFDSFVKSRDDWYSVSFTSKDSHSIDDM